MTGDEIDPPVGFVFLFRGVVENDVRSFLQVFFKMRIVDLAHHNRRRSLEPDYLFEFATPQHAIEHAFDVAYRSGQRHSFTNEKIDGQVVEVRVSLPGVDTNILEWNTDELNRLAHAEPAA